MEKKTWTKTELCDMLISAYVVAGLLAAPRIDGDTAIGVETWAEQYADDGQWTEDELQQDIQELIRQETAARDEQ